MIFASASVTIRRSSVATFLFCDRSRATALASSRAASSLGNSCPSISRAPDPCMWKKYRGIREHQLVSPVIGRLRFAAIGESCGSSRRTAHCLSRCEDVLQLRYHLPMPFLVMKPEAIFKCRLCHGEAPGVGGSSLGLSATGAVCILLPVILNNVAYRT
jgi:hypothetical protein